MKTLSDVDRAVSAGALRVRAAELDNYVKAVDNGELEPTIVPVDHARWERDVLLRAANALEQTERADASLPVQAQEHLEIQQRALFESQHRTFQLLKQMSEDMEQLNAEVQERTARAPQPGTLEAMRENRVIQLVERGVNALERLASAIHDEDTPAVHMVCTWLPEDLVQSAVAIAKTLDDATDNIGIRVNVVAGP